MIHLHRVVLPEKVETVYFYTSNQKCQKNLKLQKRKLNAVSGPVFWPDPSFPMKKREGAVTAIGFRC